MPEVRKINRKRWEPSRAAAARRARHKAWGTSHRLVYGQRGTARLGKRAKGDPTPGEPSMDLGEDARGAEGMAENTFSSCEVLDLADNGQAKRPRRWLKVDSC